MEEIRQTERETLKFRLLSFFVVAALVLLQQVGVARFRAPQDLNADVNSLWVLLLFGVAYVAYTLALGKYLLPAWRWSADVAFLLMMVVDTVAVLLATHLLGGVDSPVFILYPLAIVYYAIYRGYVGGFAAAMLLSIAYTGYSRLFQPPTIPATTIAQQVPLFFLIATLGGYLASARLRERREKGELQQFIRVETGARQLLEVARDIGRTLEVATVARKLADAAPLVGGYTRCLVAVADPEHGTLEGRAANFPPRELGLSRITDVHIPVDALGASPQEWVGPQDGAGPPAAGALPAWAAGWPVGSMALVPLRSGSELNGVLLYWSLERLAPSQEVSGGLLAGFTDLAAVSLANAQLYNRSQQRVTQLMTEMESVIRRLERTREAQKKSVLDVDGLRVDGPQEAVTLDGHPVNLTPTEFELLYCLAENSGVALNQETLLRRVWGPEYRGQGNVVDVCVHRLRRKLEATPGSPKLILTIRGAGYMLASSGRGGGRH